MTPPSLFPDTDPPELDTDTARYPDRPGEPTVAELARERCVFCSRPARETWPRDVRESFPCCGNLRCQIMISAVR